MARAYYRDVVTSIVTGAPITGASVTVKDTGGSTLTLYSGPSGAGTLSNPLTSDASGEFAFYLAEPQLCDLTVVASGQTTRTVRVSVPGPDNLHTGALLAFYGGTGQSKPSLTGGRGASQALKNLLTQLVTFGMATDGSTAGKSGPAILIARQDVAPAWFVDIADYVCDGASDEVQWKLALQEVASNGYPPGYLVGYSRPIVPWGQFNFGSAIGYDVGGGYHFPNDLAIVSPGLGPAVIYSVGNVDLFNVVTTGSRIDRFYLRGIDFAGQSGASNSALVLKGFINALIADCRVRDFGYEGLVLADGSADTTKTGYNNTIWHTQFNGCGRDAVQLANEGCHIGGNSFIYRPGRYGVNVSDAFAEVNGLTVEGPVTAGVYAFNNAGSAHDLRLLSMLVNNLRIDTAEAKYIWINGVYDVTIGKVHIDGMSDESAADPPGVDTKRGVGLYVDSTAAVRSQRISVDGIRVRNCATGFQTALGTGSAPTAVLWGHNYVQENLTNEVRVPGGYVEASPEALSGWVADDAQTATLGSGVLPPYTEVVEVRVTVAEAFNSDGSDVVDIGWDADHDALGVAVDVSTIGVKTVTLGVSAGYNASERTVKAYYTPGGSQPLAGKALVTVRYQRVLVQVA